MNQRLQAVACGGKIELTPAQSIIEEVKGCPAGMGALLERVPDRACLF